MEFGLKVFHLTALSIGLTAILSIQLCYLVSDSYGMTKMNLTVLPTAHPDDLERVWPDLACHSPTFNPEPVKQAMDSCLGKPHNRPHFSVCHLTCTIKSLKVLKISKDNTTLMTDSPSAKKEMMNIVADEAVATKLLKSMADNCAEIYIKFTYEERQDSSEEAKLPRPCNEWDEFVSCIDQALKCNAE